MSAFVNYLRYAAGGQWWCWMSPSHARADPGAARPQATDDPVRRRHAGGVASMPPRYRVLAAACLLLASGAEAQNTLVETPTPEPPVGPAWGMPVQAADQRLPCWLQFDAQYRSRVEESGHIGFRPGSDTYGLSQL